MRLMRESGLVDTLEEEDIASVLSAIVTVSVIHDLAKPLGLVLFEWWRAMEQGA